MGQANFDISAVNAELQVLAEENRAQELASLDLADEVLRTSGNWVQDIEEMHTKFGVNKVIRTLDREKLLAFLKFRLDFLQEELTEAMNAYAILLSTSAAASKGAQTAKINGVDAADDVIDAMIDLCVVAIGTLDALDVQSYKAWNAVHEKNMQKEPGIKPERPNPLGLPDLIKPAGWTAPTHADNIGLLSKLF